MRVSAHELHETIAALETATLRRIASASGDEYTPEARTTAREVLATRAFEPDPMILDAPGPPRWSDVVPARIRQMLPVYAIAAVVTTLAAGVPFIGWPSEQAGQSVTLSSPLATTFIAGCLAACLSWTIVVGILREYAYVQLGVCAIYMGVAAATFMSAIVDRSFGAALFAPFVAWRAIAFSRDPEVNAYYDRLRSAGNAKSC